jgi:hypothetical protein
MPGKPMDASRMSDLMGQLTLAALMDVFPLPRVQEALRETGTQSVRYRLLPAESVVYLVMMMALHSEASVRENVRLLLEQVRRREGSQGQTVPVGSAISQARKRLASKPLMWLFEHFARPQGQQDTPGCFWKGYRVVAADDTQMDLQGTEANRTCFGIHSNNHGQVGYPQLKVATVVECGTRLPFALTWGGVHDWGPGLFDRLRDALTTEMLLLADRGFYSFERWKACAGRCGALVWRVKKSLILRPLERLPDGSYLAQIRPSSKLVRKGLCETSESMTVRVVQYRVLLEDGSRGEHVRLITTILHTEQASAQQLAELYAERWTIETGLDELKTHLRGPGRVLRSQLPQLVEQELVGFMLAYYVVRTVMLEAARKSGLPPARLSFTHTVRVIRRKVAFPPSGHPADACDLPGDT